MKKLSSSPSEAIKELRNHIADGMLARQVRAFPIPSGRGNAIGLTRGLFRFILKISARHQIGLAVITTLLFLISAAPLELQRRILNDALQRGDFITIATLAVVYFGVAVAQGAIKLAMNVYRGWVSENSTRYLRSIVLAALGRGEIHAVGSRTGVDISIVLAEADPVGTFVGVSFSEPLLQCGILLSLLAYMTYLQPWMALIALGALAPQILYVPAMQNAINRRATGRILTLRVISTALNRHITGSIVATRLLKRADRIFNFNMSIYKIKYFMNFLMNGSFHLSMAGILALGGYYVAVGKLDAGSVIACTAGLTKINDPWGDLVDWFRELRVTQAKYALIRDAEMRAFDSETSARQVRALRPSKSE
jgi:ABC-type bacteriocin/lantibiotic exporter with double-glycine peptidase domain